MSTASELDLTSLDKDPRLFLYTSLTAGSSHIVSATSRLETILKANKIPFLAVDLATDEKCRRLWQRRGGAKKKLPGLVKEGYILGDLEEVEEWNEFGELKENIGPVPPTGSAPPGAHVGVSTAPPLSANVTAAQGDRVKVPPTGFDKTKAVALPGAEEMAAIHKAKKARDVAEMKEDKMAEMKEGKGGVEVKEDEMVKMKDGMEVSEAKEDKVGEESKSIEPAKEEEESKTAKTKPVNLPKESKKDGDDDNTSPESNTTEEEGTPQHHPTEQTNPPTQDETPLTTTTTTTTTTISTTISNDPPTQAIESLEIKEDDDGDDAPASSSSSSLKVNNDDIPTVTQEQNAKDPEAAGKTVAD